MNSLEVLLYVDIRFLSSLIRCDFNIRSTFPIFLLMIRQRNALLLSYVAYIDCEFKLTERTVNLFIALRDLFSFKRIISSNKAYFYRILLNVRLHFYIFDIFCHYRKIIPTFLLYIFENISSLLLCLSLRMCQRAFMLKKADLTLIYSILSALAFTIPSPNFLK